MAVTSETITTEMHSPERRRHTIQISGQSKPKSCLNSYHQQMCADILRPKINEKQNTTLPTSNKKTTTCIIIADNPFNTTTPPPPPPPVVWFRTWQLLSSLAPQSQKKLPCLA